jgi:membrane dipeptidase
MLDHEAVHGAAVVVDCHNDLLMLCQRRPPTGQAAYFRERWLPQLHAGGVNVQVLPVYIDDEFRPEGALRQTLRMIECGHRIAEANDDAVRVCLDGDEIDDALAGGRIALVLALEGCEALSGDVELLSTMFRLGVRMASLTHFGRTALADGSAEDAAAGRLTRAGIDAVSLMQDLGMIVDVSHLSATGTDHVLDLADRPIVASHSSCFALRPHHRNLTDHRLERIGRNGGVIGINIVSALIASRPATVNDIVSHVRHACEVAGAANVGLGCDFVKEILDELHPLENPLMLEGMYIMLVVPGLAGPAGLQLITEALLGDGLPHAHITGVLGENFLRLFRSELGRPRNPTANSLATASPTIPSAGGGTEPTPMRTGPGEQASATSVPRRHH